MTKEELYSLVEDRVVKRYLTNDDFYQLFWFYDDNQLNEAKELLRDLDIELVEKIPEEAIVSNSDESETDDSEELENSDLNELLINIDDEQNDEYDELKLVSEKYVHKRKETVKQDIIIRDKVTQTNKVLCKLIQQGSKQAEQDLCTKNIGLVKKYAHTYCKAIPNKLEFEDVLQAGFEGLIRAAKYFDFDYGTEFSTYAVIWIKQSIMRELFNNGNTVRIPVHMMERIQKFQVLDKKLALKVPDFQERKKIIADKMELDVDKIEEAVRIRNSLLSTTSLDIPIGEDQDSFLIEFIESKTYESPEEVYDKNELSRKLEDLLKDLKEREREVLILRFGLRDGHPRTLEEVGKDFHVTRERIRQIESKALRKLRNPVRSTLIKDFLYD